MNFGQLLTTIEEYMRAGIWELETLTDVLNDAFGDWLASQGVSRIVILGDTRVCLNVRGHLKSEHPAEGIKCYSRFIMISLDIVAPEQITAALGGYESDGDGSYVWIVPDGYMAALTPAEQAWEAEGGGYFSHESICVSNTADRETLCRLEVLYEDPALANVACEFSVPAQRSVHYRLDKLTSETGEPLIAKDAPVSYKLTSRDARVVVQGSRILTSGEDSTFASFGTVMGWCPQ